MVDPSAPLRVNTERSRGVEGKPSQAHQSVSASLCEMIRVADEEELEAAMLQIVRRMFGRQTEVERVKRLFYVSSAIAILNRM
ncbi:hypothetical protein [Coleofasciculus sp. E1-EBD-02]|uniref:hypothetical protein n=1 Tax=Coleofasciculus sp. E1-EBD-02 TaxID=3068481 RepID=UPI0033051E9A